MVTFALGIPHTPWVPERVASLSRLLDSIRPPPTALVDDRVFQDREPNWAWSEKLWMWTLDTGATHCLQLQDDVIVGPEFWPTLESMTTAVPDAIIGLESVLDIGAPWYTTGDGLIGVGYVVPCTILATFLNWRSKLRPRAIQSLNEDQLLGMFAFDQRLRIWHPNPTIIDHDVAIASTYGNDAHPHRRPAMSTVRGATVPASWVPSVSTPHVPKFYLATPDLCRHWILGFSFDRWKKS